MAGTMSKKDSWETQEVINWLSNDESAYTELSGEDADTIERYVVQEHMAPEGLYESFDQDPPSSFEDVDWEEVAECLDLSS